MQSSAQWHRMHPAWTRVQARSVGWLTMLCAWCMQFTYGLKLFYHALMHWCIHNSNLNHEQDSMIWQFLCNFMHRKICVESCTISFWNNKGSTKKRSTIRVRFDGTKHCYNLRHVMGPKSVDDGWQLANPSMLEVGYLPHIHLYPCLFQRLYHLLYPFLTVRADLNTAETLITVLNYKRNHQMSQGITYRYKPGTDISSANLRNHGRERHLLQTVATVKLISLPAVGMLKLFLSRSTTLD